MLHVSPIKVRTCRVNPIVILLLLPFRATDIIITMCLQICLSFNVRSVGRNKDKQTVGDRLLELFLHSLGVILTSVQETDMKYGWLYLPLYM